MIPFAASIVARACPRACRSVLSIDAPEGLDRALGQLGVDIEDEPVAPGSVGAVFMRVKRCPGEARLRSLRLALVRRGRLFALCEHQALPAFLTCLARSGLHPKQLHLPGLDPPGWVLVMASAGRAGGLVVRRVAPDPPGP